MKTPALLSVLIFCTVSLSYGQWRYTNLSSPKERMGVTTSGTKAFFAGGHDGNTTLNLVESYDVVTGSWANTGNLIIPRQVIAGVACGSKLFFGGGANANLSTVYSTVDIYDTATGQWSTGQLSVARFDIAAVSKGNKVLFAGGSNFDIVCTSVVDIYDFSTGTWSTDNLSIARGGMAAAVVGDLAVFAGGFINGGEVSSRVDIYNFATDTWSTDELSEARVWASAVTVGNKVIIAGGMKSFPNIPSNVVDIFDASTETWSTKTPLSVPRAWISAGTVKGKAYFAGGCNVANGGIIYDLTDIIDIYDVANETWSTDVLFQPKMGQGLSVGNYFLVAGGNSDEGLLSLVEILHDSTNFIPENANHLTVNIYPNPADQLVRISIKDGTVFEEASIYTHSGQLVYQGIPDDNTLDISSLQPGVYILEVNYNNQPIRGKLVIE